MEEVKFSDSELIWGLHEHSTAIFEHLYTTYFDELYNFAYHFVMRRDDADDIVHDLFVKLWRDPYRIRPESNLRGFLYMTVKNASLNKLRQRRLVDKHQLRLVESLMFAYGDQVDAVENDEQMCREVKRCFDQLTPQQQQIIRMKTEGLSYAEISESLHIAPETVHVHIKRAYKLFRDQVVRFEDYLKLILFF